MVSRVVIPDYALGRFRSESRRLKRIVTNAGDPIAEVKDALALVMDSLANQVVSVIPER
jgi:hypothetical protein